MMVKPIFRTFLLLNSLLLAGCAANQLPGFQNVYYSYDIPQTLLDRIMLEFREHGLVNARVSRDNVGRVLLTGSYRNEDDVDAAFIIAQSNVGLKSTSPFYPKDIKEKRWEIEAAKALGVFSKAKRTAVAPTPTTSTPGQKRALVIGINDFLDATVGRIKGEDDALVVKARVTKAGYAVTALLGKDATKSNIEAALGKIERELGANDSLFIYISSHGTQPVPSPKGKDQRKMSIVAYDSGDTDGIKRKGTVAALHMQATSVPDTLVQQLAKKPARFTRILIDTCYSGEMVKDIPADSRAYIMKTNGGQPERASISLASWTGPEYSSKGIRLNAESVPASSAQEHARSRQKNSGQDHVDPSRSGYTIITATSENELAWGPNGNGTFQSPVTSAKMLKGSFFTQAFFEYLDEYRGDIEPAFEKAREFTENKVRAIPPPDGPAHQVPRLAPRLPTANPGNLYQ